jgi:hypothetical protein
VNQPRFPELPPVLIDEVADLELMVFDPRDQDGSNIDMVLSRWRDQIRERVVQRRREQERGQ